MIDILLKKNAKIGSFIDHTVIISEFHNLGVGNIVLRFCAIEPFNVVSNYNIFNFI
jgi:hypothetical protein